jgi:hypothetical protein
MLIVALLLVGVGFLMPGLAVVTGIVALVKISRSRGALKGRGLAIGGIVLGSLSLMSIVPFIFLLLVPASMSRVPGGGDRHGSAPEPSPAMGDRSSLRDPSALRLLLQCESFDGEAAAALEQAIESQFAAHDAEARYELGTIPGARPEERTLSMEIDFSSPYDVSDAQQAEEDRARLFRSVEKYIELLQQQTGWFLESHSLVLRP